MKKVISILIIIIGLSIFFYPKISQYLNELKQQRLLEQWQNAAPELYGQANEETTNGITEENTVFKKNMIGILIIDKIDLSLPILNGVTAQNMNLGVARFSDGALPGQAGNCAIAGHRNHAYGRMFNRLDELEIGDYITVQTKENTYTYTVSEKLFVQPDETWVLNGSAAKKEITLITCQPLYHPTGRLVIKGELTNEEVN
jgi:sortase A